MVIQNNYKLCGGIQRGACAPLCVVAGEGSIREGPHRKGPSLVRPFGYFSGEGKVPRGTGAEAPKELVHGGPIEIQHYSFLTNSARMALRTARTMTPTSAKMASHMLAAPRATRARQASLTPMAKTMFW